MSTSRRGIWSGRWWSRPGEAGAGVRRPSPPPRGRLPEPVRDGEVLDPAHELRGHPPWLAVELDGLDPIEDLAEECPELLGVP